MAVQEEESRISIIYTVLVMAHCHRSLIGPLDPGTLLTACSFLRSLTALGLFPGAPDGVVRGKCGWTMYNFI